MNHHPAQSDLVGVTVAVLDLDLTVRVLGEDDDAADFALRPVPDKGHRASA